MRAFVTGSRVFGEPTESSDYDIVILCNDDVQQIITERFGENGTVYIKDLNLILCTREEDFHAWREGTNILIERSVGENRPIPREEAKKVFKMCGAGRGYETGELK